MSAAPNFTITQPFVCGSCGIGFTTIHWCRPAWCMTTSAPITPLLSNNTRQWSLQDKESSDDG